MKKFIFVLFLIAPSIFAQQDITKYFEGINGCFVLYNFNKNEYIRYNTERCVQRFLPASTFKIPNSLILLEEKIAPDQFHTIKWDSVERGWDKWDMDQDMRSAFKYSALWYYQALARRMEKEIYSAYLDKFNYGNQTVGEKIDYFWLDWSLRISANEQVEFLKKLVKNNLPVSQRSIDITKEIMIVEEAEDYTLRAKTGLGEKKDGIYTGWYVGYVGTDDNTYVFAMNMEEEDYENIKSQIRIELTKNVLKELGILK